jgi:hypothetical protein
MLGIDRESKSIDGRYPKIPTVECRNQTGFGSERRRARFVISRSFVW